MSLPSFSIEEETKTGSGEKVIAWNFLNNEILIKNMYVQTVKGKEAIKNKVIKILKTDKGLAAIYEGKSYGINRESIIGKEYYSNKTLVENLIEDIKSQIKKIVGVNGVIKLEAQVEDSILSISFTLDTIYGEVGETTNV